MIIKRKEKESNFSLLRRFNREMLVDGKLARVKEKKEFTKALTRRHIRQAAVRREELRKQYQEY